ncbi:Glutathione S-transferase kappa 1 [Metarhizium anisopliae]|nr:Glutathione S-transferase kappa 1 [Metarhizium anisopliae]
MAGGRIDCYLDLDLRLNLDKLAAHGVDVDLTPSKGNRPPWTLPAKARYLIYDNKRAAARVGITEYQAPDDLFERAKTQSALRALLFIKANYPKEKLLSAMHFLLHKFWTPPNADVVDESSLRALLAQATETPSGGAKLFTEEEVGRIMDGRAEMKKKLIEDTAKVVESGAFGCPWFLVTNSRGETQPFFGSDRFNHIYMHLGIPFQDVAILPPSSAAKL